MTNEVKLRVVEALQEEAYKGIVKIDSETMHAIDVRPGDVVEIEGGRKTVGIVDRAYPSDVGQKVIRVDGLVRRNAKTAIGENVIVRKAVVKEAKEVTIAPAQEGVIIKADGAIFKRGLLGRAVMKGDVVALGGAQRRRRAMSDSPFFEDIFNIEEEIMGHFAFSNLKFIIVDTNPKNGVLITENTRIKVNPKAVDVVEDNKVPEYTYEDIGGLSEEIKKIREMVEIPLKHPELFARLGIEPPKGVLLHGPPGCGKTLLAKAVANESDAKFYSINGPEVTSKFVGEAEKKIREIFDEAEKNAPAIIFFDEIDAIAAKRDETYGEVEKRMVSQLLTTMDGLKSRGKVIVMAATNRPNSLDPALRRPGRFDREIDIGIPSKKGRLNILQIHTRNMPLTKDVNLKKLADLTHGFVGADLEALCKEAAMSVIRRIVPEINLKEDATIPASVLEKLQITMKDFYEAMKIVNPSALREVLVEAPNVKWSDIGGLENLKQELKEAVEWPLKHPQVFKKLGIRPPKGVLMYGPPGCGKTLLAKAVANESEANFILVKGPELISKWVGESEKGIREIFKKAKQSSPTIIFFDEIDAIATRRGTSQGTQVTERVVNQLLTEMDGLEELNDVVVIAATNRPDMIDAGLLRPGRFDRIIMTNVPDKEARLEIFKIHTRNMPLAKDVNLEKLAEMTENYVGADIEAVVREAAILALRDDLKVKEVSMKYFELALKKVKSSILNEDVQKYKEIEEKYLRTARGAAIRNNNQSYFG
ncbi:AAA family ATPase [Candidatus Woesearchaeota archaeon]|nr:MAG: AAA family ATPase [Candidatus Woesearchaeota archaeon]